MARVHFVKKARKDNPSAGIKKGDSYYWWAFMVGGRGGPKHYSKTQPKQSQLTSSDFLSRVYELQERIEGMATPDTIEDVESAIEELTSEISDISSEQEDKLSNMPEGLQQGPTGELLQSRIDELESWKSELEGIDVSFDEPEQEEGESEEDYEERKQEELDEKLNELLGEIQSTSYNGE